MNHSYTNEYWDPKLIDIDEVFAFTMACEIMNDFDFERQSIDECRERHDWPKWEEAIQAELTSLAKRQVFGPIIRTPEDV